ncbi:MAG: DUF1559 domain-containing protein [Gemmataceae bacterium]|nr:DUF1559 domain-containing protein [Gemmataceae bacterium]
MAVAAYHDQHKHYPLPYLTDARGKPAHSWRVLLLPYVEGKALHDRYDFTTRWDTEANRALASSMPRHYAFHSTYQPGLTVTNYLAVVGPETLWPGQKKLSAADVTDGSSTTVLIVENLGANIPWLEPRDLTLATMSLQLNDPAGISSPHANPAVVMVDASLRQLKPGLSPEVLRALLTARGGEPVAEEGEGWVILPDGRQRERKQP